MNTLKELPKAAFGQKVHSYEAHAVVQQDAAAWLAEWLPESAKLSNCLELGAGTGVLTQHLMERFFFVEASDIEPGMVSYCNEKHPNATHTVRDAWLLQSDLGEWDHLSASSLLHWAPSPSDVLKNWQLLLKKNGRLTMSLFIKPSLPEMLEVIGGESPVEWRTEAQWRALFQGAGFDCIRMETQTRRYHYPRALDFWKSMHSTGTVVSRGISPTQMMRFFRDYELQFTDALGVYATWTFCRVELRA